MYELRACITTDKLPPRNYTFWLDKTQNNSVQYKGTDEAVDGLMDIICNSVALGRGDSAHFEDLIFNNIDQNEVYSFRDGSTVSFAYYAKDLVERITFEFDRKNHVKIAITTRTEHVVYETDFDGMVKLGEGISILLGVIIRRKCRFITYLFDHFSIYDCVTRKYYTTDNNVINYRKIYDANTEEELELNRKSIFISKDILDHFDGIVEKYDGYWGPVLCSAENKNFTVILAQETNDYLKSIMQMFKEFYSSYPYAFPTLVVNTWSEDGDPKRTPFSGCIGSLFKKFMNEIMGENDPIANTIFNHLINGSSYEARTRDGNDAATKAIENYMKTHGMSSEDYTPIDIIKAAQYDNPESIGDALNDVDLDPRLVSAYIQKIIEQGVDIGEVRGIMASIDKITNEVNICYFDGNGELHNPIPFSTLDEECNKEDNNDFNIQFIKPAIDDIDLDRFAKDPEYFKETMGSLGMYDDEDDNDEYKEEE